MRSSLALVFALIAAPAVAQTVIVDASPIAAQGYPTFARRVEAAVAPVAAQAFAGFGRPDQRIVMRIHFVDLPVLTGSSREGENDIMRSEAFLLDRSGRVVASASVLSPVPAWSASASLPIEIEEHRRMRQLGLHAAYWLRNRLGGS